MNREPQLMAAIVLKESMEDGRAREADRCECITKQCCQTLQYLKELSN